MAVSKGIYTGEAEANRIKRIARPSPKNEGDRYQMKEYTRVHHTQHCYTSRKHYTLTLTRGNSKNKSKSLPPVQHTHTQKYSTPPLRASSGPGLTTPAHENGSAPGAHENGTRGPWDGGRSVAVSSLSLAKTRPHLMKKYGKNNESKFNTIGIFIVCVEYVFFFGYFCFFL